MRFIFKHIRDRNVQPPLIFILFLIGRRYQDKECIGQSLVFREDNFKSRGVLKSNELMFTFPWKKSRSARVNSNYHPTAFTLLEDSLIRALVHGSITIFLESRGAQEKPACCNRCSILLQALPYSLHTSSIKKNVLPK